MPTLSRSVFYFQKLVMFFGVLEAAHFCSFTLHRHHVLFITVHATRGYAQDLIQLKEFFVFVLSFVFPLTVKGKKSVKKFS